MVPFDYQEHMQNLLAGLPPKSESGYFGLEIPVEAAAVALVPVSWDVTTSYSDGTRRAPEQIRQASHQLDLEHAVFGPVFLAGIAASARIEHPDHAKLRGLAEQVISSWEEGENALITQAKSLASINMASADVTGRVYAASQALLNQDKIVGVVGGDHSCPLGLLRAVNELGEKFSVLHIDAHHDLRNSYEGFKESHASIMFNALQQCHNLDRLVAVGIRDYAADEKDLATQDPRIHTFYDANIQERKLLGVHFAEIAEEVIGNLSDIVYISCDIDGLDPTNCPGTGTPVPGGLSYSEFNFLMQKLADSGKRVIAFDLCEVGGEEEWDANVGARVLYTICGAALKSQNKLRNEL